ncbi:hypothetical protein [Ensifer adhaerens]|uniref:hypothetical protein n=1 Tax=Ensifer adhaerens TaxID=106592 RepID=UPI000DC5633F|nr:hypothetical protein [Ensifer adhaerens]RAS13534.1 hypothetical protein DEU52_106132 [Ensifer adhaerens]
MSEIPDDIMKAADDCADELYFKDSIERSEGVQYVAQAILAERTRCLTIIQSIETTSAQGMRVIDEIVRKVRGDE